MKFVKKASKIVIVAGIFLVAFAAYIVLTSQKENKKNPANTFIGSDFSVSKTTTVPTVTPTPTPTPTPKPLAKNAFRYAINEGVSQKSFDFVAEKGQTVFSVLEKLSKEQNIPIQSKYYPKMGILVQSIDKLVGGDEGRYWQYYVNGALGQVAADKQELKAGDSLEWRFEKVPEY